MVHAVLFYSPTCPHCHEVITNFLIPLQDEYGSRLVILGMDTSQAWANELFWEALRYYEVPEDRWAVPFMIVDDQILVGGDEIPSRLPRILDDGLAAGGIDLPDLPALTTFLAEQDLLDERYPGRRIAKQTTPQDSQDEGGATPAPEEPGPDTTPAPEAVVPDTGPEPTGATPDIAPSEAGAAAGGIDEAAVHEEAAHDSMPASTTAPGGEGGEPGAGAGSGGNPGRGEPLGLQDAATRMGSMTLRDRFSQDPAGNSLAVLVLLGMLISLAFTAAPGRVSRSSWPVWLFPLLVLAGMGVAAYLSIVEVTRVEAVCGPVGDCNTVNQSEYARLFGVIPVGILGLAGYALLLLLWIAVRWGPESFRTAGRLGLWAGALFGVLFSIYLTFLEPFVIGATCAWCLTSAVLMTLLLWAAAPEAAQVWPGREGGERAA